jgi:hypothetical protein
VAFDGLEAFTTPEESASLAEENGERITRMEKCVQEGIQNMKSGKHD